MVRERLRKYSLKYRYNTLKIHEYFRLHIAKLHLKASMYIRVTKTTFINKKPKQIASYLKMKVTDFESA